MAALLTLLLVAASSSAYARDLGGATAHKRDLAQISTDCPIPGCDPNFCQAVTGGYQCGRCSAQLLLRNNRCHCPAGRYGTFADCAACPKNSYCPGGLYERPNTPLRVACPVTAPGTPNEVQMVTAGLRSTSISQCLNPPGTYYVLNSTFPAETPSAVPCPLNTYTRGMRKNRACVPCPPGYITETTRNTAIQACVVPAGYFLKSLGVVAPCPQGEYKVGIGEASQCTRCAPGVTTANATSTSESACTVLLPGRYAKVIASTTGAINETAACPLAFYCPGGAATAPFDPAQPTSLTGTTVVRCHAATVTQGEGASAPHECLTPPGYRATVDGMVECADGTFRAEWKPRTAATTCTACGTGISSYPIEQITVVDNTTTPANSAWAKVVLVRGSSASCYIKPGQGLRFDMQAGSYSAVWCNNNNYGVAGDAIPGTTLQARFGLTPQPCRQCPVDMVTNIPSTIGANPNYFDEDGFANGNGGFTSPDACVTKPGFGYEGRAAYKCPVGSYNPGNNREECKQCPPGMTTRDNSTQQVSIADCGLASGSGYHDGTIVTCPIGTYNQFDPRFPNTTACTTCPDQTTTAQPGGRGVEDCNLCLPGWGHNSTYIISLNRNPPNCRTRCGGANGATFGSPARAIGTNCTSCPAITSGYYFLVNGVNQPYIPTMVTRPSAESEGDCLAEFAQIGDTGAWYMGGSATLTPVDSASTLEACAEACRSDANCQYITFHYGINRCYKKVASGSAYAGLGGAVVGFKALSAADTGAEAQQVAGKTVASGAYSFWWEDATAIGTPSDPISPTPSSFRACLDACDNDAECAAVGMTRVTVAASNAAQLTSTIGSCRLIKGVAITSTDKRSLTRAVITRTTLPAAPGSSCSTLGVCGTGNCEADVVPWSKCTCPTGKYWDVVQRNCVDFRRELRADKSFMMFTKEQHRKTFMEARQECFKAGGELASVRDRSESAQLASLLQQEINLQNGTATLAWFGLARRDYPSILSRTTDKSEWTWMSTNLYPEWDNWLSGQPDSAGNGIWKEGVCAAIRLNAGGVWQDNRCFDSWPFVCMEKDFCAGNPCGSGATCDPDGTAWQGYRCRCTDSNKHWNGTQCANKDFTKYTYNGVNYLLFPNILKSFTDAMDICRARQSQLASFSNAGDAAAVAVKLNELGVANNGNAWIGLASQGYPDAVGDYATQWLWLDTGRAPPTTPLNWINGEPGNSTTANICGGMMVGTQIPNNADRGKWIDLPCSTEAPFACLESRTV